MNGYRGMMNRLDDPYTIPRPVYDPYRRENEVPKLFSEPLPNTGTKSPDPFFHPKFPTEVEVKHVPVKRNSILKKTKSPDEIDNSKGNGFVNASLDLHDVQEEVSPIDVHETDIPLTAQLQIINSIRGKTDDLRIPESSTDQVLMLPDESIRQRKFEHQEYPNTGAIIRDDQDIRKLEKRTKKTHNCLIAASVFLSITLAGLIVTVVLLLLGPCYRTHCDHGYCDWSGASVTKAVCLCEDRWTGQFCDRELVVRSNLTEISLTWDHARESSDRGWRVLYSEAASYPDESSLYTTDTSATINNLKPGEIYRVHVERIDWEYKVTSVLEDSFKLQRHESELLVNWTTSSQPGTKGFFVRVSRLRRRQDSSQLVAISDSSVTLDHLTDCTEYVVQINVITADLMEETIAKTTETTTCLDVASGWSLGDSIIVGGWSGGAEPFLSGSHCNQLDAFPSIPTFSPSCPADETTGRVGEAVTNVLAHSGTQSWWYKRGHPIDDQGPGCPFSPQLSVEVGRSDQEYRGQADRFHAQIWIRAADPTGDGSRVEIAGGGSRGDARVSTALLVESLPTGLTFTTMNCQWESCSANCTDRCGGNLTHVVPHQSWVLLEMELLAANEDYGDLWEYSINGSLIFDTRAYFTALELDNGEEYTYINRLKIKSSNVIVKNTAYQGFLFDDIRIEAYNSNAPTNILDTYATSFESNPIILT